MLWQQFGERHLHTGSDILSPFGTPRLKCLPTVAPYAPTGVKFAAATAKVGCPANLERLRAVKRQYDPDNVCRHTIYAQVLQVRQYSCDGQKGKRVLPLGVRRERTRHVSRLAKKRGSCIIHAALGFLFLVHVTSMFSAFKH